MSVAPARSWQMEQDPLKRDRRSRRGMVHCSPFCQQPCHAAMWMLPHPEEEADVNGNFEVLGVGSIRF